MLQCPGGGKLKPTQSSVHVPRSYMQKAAEDYLSNNRAVGIKWPLRLYITNHKAASTGANPTVVMDSANPADVRSTDVIGALVNNGADCISYYIKDFNRDDFRQLNSGARSGSGTSSSERQGLKPMGSEKNPFRDPGIKMAMNREIWEGVGFAAGWLKESQAQQPNSAQIQRDMAENVKNQQQEAQSAQQAQQGLAALREQERTLLAKQKEVNDQIMALQKSGNGQDPKQMAPLQTQLMEINEQLEPIKEQLKKYEELNNTIETAKNPQMAAGLRLA